MSGSEVTLRSLVDKWLAPTFSAPAHVAQVGRLLATRSRFVRIDRRTSSGALTIVFFRHNDGSWCVFPPAQTKPAMCQSLAEH
ncbi:hypothetical protein [Paraburkholderia sp. J67]|uniref:hypothetical protein n=1 Tax=Paraburkholderia sp. J67 TaxID=2805435 RepID=UPI002ABDF9BD|nr:hypothetical protein [Paraburkholderia sp. J67]